MVIREDQATKDRKKKSYVPRNTPAARRQAGVTVSLIIDCGTWRENKRKLIIFAYLLNKVTNLLYLYVVNQEKNMLSDVFRTRNQKDLSGK